MIDPVNTGANILNPFDFFPGTIDVEADSVIHVESWRGDWPVFAGDDVTQNGGEPDHYIPFVGNHSESGTDPDLESDLIDLAGDLGIPFGG